MKKAKGDFKDYGDDAEAVMYALATKMAKESKIKKQMKVALPTAGVKKYGKDGMKKIPCSR